MTEVIYDRRNKGLLREADVRRSQRQTGLTLNKLILKEALTENLRKRHALALSRSGLPVSAILARS